SCTVWSGAAVSFFFFQAEDGIRDFHVTGVQRVLFRSVGVEPVRHAHEGDGPDHSFHLLGRQLLRLDHERGQELCVRVPGVPERQGELVVRADLLRQGPDVSELDPELMVTGAALGVLRTHLGLAERFELLEGLVQRHGHTVISVDRKTRLSVRTSTTTTCWVPGSPKPVLASRCPTCWRWDTTSDSCSGGGSGAALNSGE